MISTYFSSSKKKTLGDGIDRTKILNPRAWIENAKQKPCGGFAFGMTILIHFGMEKSRLQPQPILFWDVLGGCQF